MCVRVAAVRVGIVMFAIPFVFAWYPEILLIEEAVTITNDAGQKVLLEGYSSQTDWGHLSLLLLRLTLSLYLLASALARFDRAKINGPEAVLRLLLAVLILWKTPLVIVFAIGAAAVLLSWHHITAGRAIAKRAVITERV